MRPEAEGKGDKQSMLRKVLCREDYGEENAKKKKGALEKRNKGPSKGGFLHAFVTTQQNHLPQL